MQLTDRQKTALAVALIGFAAVKAAALWWWHSRQTPAAAVASCRVAEQGCPFAGGAVFRLTGVGGNTTPFAAEAHGLPPAAKRLTVSFRMKDMDMGFNRFELHRQDNGVWRAEGIRLPFCTASRHDWEAEWTLDGEKFQAAFTTR